MKEPGILDKNLKNFFFKTEGKKTVISFPTFWHKKPKLINALKKTFNNLYYIKVNRNKALYTLTIKTKKNNDFKQAILRLASQLNDHPLFQNVNIKKYKNPKNPIISCVILLNNNYDFLINFLLPSLISNTPDRYPCEIIVIDLSKGLQKKKSIYNFPVFSSPYSWISKAYNKGIKESHGKYIAFFHDDCIINDRHWIDKCISELNKNVSAVTPEIQTYDRLVKIKAVPLVMLKSKILDIGMFDENFIFSMEDLDLTNKILIQNWNIKKLHLNYFHYEGMSTLSIHICKRFKTFFAYNFVPKKIIIFYKKKYLENALINNHNRILNHDKIYFKNKWGPLFSKIDLPCKNQLDNIQKHECIITFGIYKKLK